jgi:hypothetical protein
LFDRPSKSNQFKSLELLLNLKNGIESNTNSNGKKPIILTLGLVKILCDGEINTKFFDKCQVIFTSQHNLQEGNIKNEEELKILIPYNKSFHNNTNVPEIFVIFFHLGHEILPPPSIAHNALQSMRSHQNSSQYFVAELLPHRPLRKMRSKPYPFFQARKSFNPICVNQLYEIQLKIPSKKQTRGKKSGKRDSTEGSPAEQDFDLTIKWSEKKVTTQRQQTEAQEEKEEEAEEIQQQPVHANNPLSKIFYHFTTKNGSPKVERSPSISCPWCRYPHRFQSTDTSTSTLPPNDEQPLLIQASSAQCHAIFTWSNLEFAGGTPYLPPGNSGGGSGGGGTKNKSSKRKLDTTTSSSQSNQQNYSDIEYLQFPSSVIWPLQIRQSMRSLLIHLNTFHSHFQYQYFCDRLLNLHIIVSRDQSPQSPLSSELLNQPISPPTAGSRRASPISHSSSSASLNQFNESVIMIPENSRNFIFYGRSWRSLYSDDFPILVVKSLDCDHVHRSSSSSSSGRDSVDRHSIVIPKNETASISLIENSYLLQEELQPISTTTTGAGVIPTPATTAATAAVTATAAATAAAATIVTLSSSSSSTFPNEELSLDSCLVGVPSAHNSQTMTRQYFHSNGFPIEEPIEKEYDSDNEVNTIWEHVHSYDLIEEFQDICYLEKKFMILWNTFINSFPIYADRYMCVGLEIFAKRFGFYILQHGLRQIFLLHLMTLWDFSLVNFNAIVKSLEIVDQYHEKYVQSQQSAMRERQGEGK